MRSVRLLLVVVMILVGVCGCVDPRRAVTREAAFGPAELRINDSFSRLRDASGDGTPDQLEASVELLDAFGDATKGAGTFSFEVFEYEVGDVDIRGTRLGETRTFALDAGAEQQRYWQPVLRSYLFRLPLDVEPGQRLVLSASYQPSAGEMATTSDKAERLFDRLVVGGS